MGRDGMEQVLVQPQAMGSALVRLKLGQRLKGFQGLNGALEADGAGQEIALTAACAMTVRMRL